MSWTNIPPTSGSSAAASTDVVAWSILRQYLGAIAERYWLAKPTPVGQDPWPRQSFAWWRGRIPTGGITASVLTDSSQNWGGGSDDLSGATYFNPWARGIAGTDDVPYIPTIWWINFDDNLHERSFKVKIRAWTATTITFENIQDLVTAGVIPSVSYLEGMRYEIFAYVHALGAGERVYPWPNDQTFGSGFVRTLASRTYPDTRPAAPTHAMIRDDNRAYTPNALVGKELLVYGDDVLTNSSASMTLHRVAITANTAHTITFATQSWTPVADQPYCVVITGRRAIPGRPTQPVYAFYLGAQDDFDSLRPDDVMGAAGLPAASVKIPTDDSGTCNDDPYPAMDLDVWTDAYQLSGSDDYVVCGRPSDKPYAPDLFKTWRGLQVAAENLAPVYVEEKSYDGASAIPTINAAKVFSLAGINSFTASTTTAVGSGSFYSSNQITISGLSTPPYTPIRVCYSIALADGTYMSGYGAMINGTTLEDGSGSVFQHNTDPTSGPQPVAEERSIIISFLWSAFTECQFKRMYDVQGCFIPDLAPSVDGAPPAPQDPPQPFFWDDPDQGPNSSDGVGKFIKLAKSTHYINHRSSSSDWTVPEGFGNEGSGSEDAFTTGNIARYMGAIYGHPNVSSSGGASPFSAGDPLSPYYARLAARAMDPKHQFLRNLQTHGVATGGGNAFSVTDTSKNWFDFQWFGGGPMRTDEGTATGGSSTSLSDSTKDDSSYLSTPTVEAHTYWEPARFQGFAGPYVGFTVAVLFGTTDWDDVDNRKIEYRLITGGTTNPVAISWAEALVNGSASGRPYKIGEPYVLSQWAERPIKLTEKGVTHTATVTGNGSNTVFFTPNAPFTPSTNTTYQILEPRIGDTFKWNGTKWGGYSGADAVRTGVHPTAHNFHVTSTENLCTLRKKYGRMVPADIFCGETYTEMYNFVHQLHWVRNGVTWTSRADDAVAENNENLASGSGSAGEPDDIALMESSAEANADADYDGLTEAVESPGTLPYAKVKTSISSPHEQGCYIVSLSRRYAYAVSTDNTDRFVTPGTFYNFARIIDDDTPASCPNSIQFDDFGDPVLNKAWKSFGSGSGVTFRARLGSLGPPGPALWCAPDLGTIPTPPTSYNANYEVIDGCVILQGNTVFLYP